MSAKYMAPALAMLLPSCTVAPNYIRPEALVVEVWPDDPMPKGTVLAQATDQLTSEIGWKTFFTDQHLQRLVQLAPDNSRDLRVSVPNIECAHGLYWIQCTDLMPGVSTSSEFSSKGVSADLPATGKQTVSRQRSPDVGATSCELDLFGRIQSPRDRVLETYLGTEETYRSARPSLVSKVAQAHLVLVADCERLNIVTETPKSQQTSCEIVVRRHSVGASSELDLHQAQTSVDTARVDIARYSGQVAKDITALNLLAGTKMTPGMLPTKALSEFPVWPDTLVSLPSVVLLQRPDILQTEHTLKAANADTGMARASFFPRISLTASIGTASNELSHLLDGSTGTWTFLPQVNLPIFKGGRNVANLRASGADKKMTVTNYGKAIQFVSQGVFNALINRVSLAGQLEAQKSLVHVTSETCRLSGERYNQGIDNYLAVLNSQRAMYNSQFNFIFVRVAREQNLIMLYKALGGGVKE